MISDQFEMSAVEIDVKFLYSKNFIKSFFINL